MDVMLQRVTEDIFTAAATRLLTCADVDLVCREARMCALRESFAKVAVLTGKQEILRLEADEGCVTPNHFQVAINIVFQRPNHDIRYTLENKPSRKNVLAH